MKKITVVLTLIFLILDRSNALVTATLRKKGNPHVEEVLNISSWSVEDAAIQTKISFVQPSPDGKYVLIESNPTYVDARKIQPSKISLINAATKEVVWKTRCREWCRTGEEVLSFS